MANFCLVHVRQSQQLIKILFRIQFNFIPFTQVFFITEQWIEALYFKNRSAYGLADFRTMASSQVG